MDLFKYLIDKSFEELPGGLYGLLSVTVVFCLSLLTVLLNPNYVFFEDMVSELGVGQGGIFFNLGLIFSGIIAIPFFISMGRTLNYDGVNEKLRKSAIIFSIIACISMSLIGYFPATPDNELISFLHGTATFISWVSGLIFIVLFSLLFLKTSKFSKFQAYMGFFVAIIFIITLCTWLPITEYAIMIAILIWVVTNATSLVISGIKGGND